MERTNEELVQEIQRGADLLSNLEKLYSQNTGLIYKIAKPLTGSVELEDLRQEAYFGIYNAAIGFDPEAGASFGTYAAYWIQATLQRYVESCGSVIRRSAKQMERIRTIRKESAAYVAAFGREPSDRQLAALTGLTMRQLEAARSAAEMVPLSMDAPTSQDDDLHSLADIVPDNRNDIEDLIEQISNDQKGAQLWAEVDKLPGDEPEVIRSIYQGEEQKQAVAQELGVTPNTITAMERRALRRLRNNKRVAALRSDEIAYHKGLARIGVGTFQSTGTSSTELAAFALLEREQRLADQELAIYIGEHEKSAAEN